MHALSHAIRSVSTPVAPAETASCRSDVSFTPKNHTGMPLRRRCAKSAGATMAEGGLPLNRKASIWWARSGSPAKDGSDLICCSVISSTVIPNTASSMVVKGRTPIWYRIRVRSIAGIEVMVGMEGSAARSFLLIFSSKLNQYTSCVRLCCRSSSRTLATSSSEFCLNSMIKQVGEGTASSASSSRGTASQSRAPNKATLCACRGSAASEGIWSCRKSTTLRKSTPAVMRLKVWS
mmetsp:Transcript_32859/g.73176  ORF Transcript_32859/g.73176 Transcript_32859/m.73176 type:complete len:235 (-) Transcript_32859:451-1155(-)